MFEGTSIRENMYLQPLTDIYLHSGLSGEIGPTGNLSYLILFSLIAILIASTGLHALTSYETEGQIKNIDIRKVYGASASEILVMLLGRFTRWVFLSFLIACPVSFYVMNRWLRHFAYKTDLSG